MIWRFQRTLSHRLLAWSALSLAAGAALWLQGDPFQRGLGLQAILWGAIDAAIALIGLRGLAVRLRRAFDPIQAAKDTRRLRRLLWVNSGLDLLYIAGGLALVYFPGQTDFFARGSGWGIILQGAFLFLFDLLHALTVPQEAYLPDLGMFSGPEHDPFDLPGERGVILLVHGFPGTPVEVRALGEHLNAAGWRVRGLLLPGFGKQIPTLFQQRAAGWSDFIAAEVCRARSLGGPVILVSFSMGAGLSIPAAAESRPDALVLAAPFWLDLSLLVNALLWLPGLLLPQAFNPFRWFSPRQMEESPAFSPPPGRLYPPAPEYFSQMKGVRIPLLFLEQFLELSRRAKADAPRLEMPILVLQGRQDRVVRPSATRRLLRLLGPQTRYQEVEGEHHIVMPDHPAFSQVCAEITAFASPISS